MRIMGLDFGSKTVGVAISDPLFVTAQGIEIIFYRIFHIFSSICHAAVYYTGFGLPKGNKL